MIKQMEHKAEQEELSRSQIVREEPKQEVKQVQKESIRESNSPSAA